MFKRASHITQSAKLGRLSHLTEVAVSDQLIAFVFDCLRANINKPALNCGQRQ